MSKMENDALSIISDGLAAVTEGCRLPVRMKNSEDWPKAEVISIRQVKAVMQYYVHYVDYNKRLDEWVTEDRLDTRKIEPPQGKEEKEKHATGATTTGFCTPKKDHSGLKQQCSQYCQCHIVQTVLAYPSFHTSPRSLRDILAINNWSKCLTGSLDKENCQEKKIIAKHRIS